MQPRGRLRQRTRETHRLQRPRVERHVAAHAALVGVLEERGLERGEPPAAPLLGAGLLAEQGGVADLQHVDLETGQDAALDAFHEADLVQDGPVQGGVVHRGDDPPAQRLTTAGRAVRVGRRVVVGYRRGGAGSPQARGRGHVQAPRGGEARLVVDGRPALRGVARRPVRLVHHHQVEGRHFLPVRAAQRRLQHAEGFVVGVVQVVGQPLPGQARVRGEHQHRAAAGPEGELCRVGGAAHPQRLQQRVRAERADGDGGAGVPGPAPRLDRLRQQVQRRDEHADHPGRAQPQRGDGRHDGLARAGGHVELTAHPAHGHRPVPGEGQPEHGRAHGLRLVGAEGDPEPRRRVNTPGLIRPGGGSGLFPLWCLLHAPMLLATRCPYPVRLLHNLASNLGQW